MNDVEIRPTLLEDLSKFEGKSSYTFQGITAVYKGEVAGIAGMALTENGYVMFMEMKENIDAPKIKIWRVARYMMSLIVKGKNVVYAGAGDKYLNSKKFLKSLGFEYFGNDARGGEIYVCQVLKH